MSAIINDRVVNSDNTTRTVLTNQAGNESKPIMATQVKTAATNPQTVEYLIFFIFGFLEILLIFRFVLKLAGASTLSAFVNFIYGLTGLLILPFEGIFNRGVLDGTTTTNILEPATLVALVVYALLAWGIVKLIHILSLEKQQD